MRQARTRIGIAKLGPLRLSCSSSFLLPACLPAPSCEVNLMNNESCAADDDRGVRVMPQPESQTVEKPQADEENRIEVKDLSVYYGKLKAVRSVSLDIRSRK